MYCVARTDGRRASSLRHLDRDAGSVIGQRQPQRLSLLGRVCLRGFSLVELLVVLAVMSILAWAATPLLELASQREKERELRWALWEIRDALDAYRRAVETGLIEGSARTAYPRELSELVEGRPNLKRPGEMMYFLRRLPKDPFAAPGTSAAQSWGLRSYASPPDQPTPGEDIFDVYSRSERIGLNGVPLRDW